MLGAMLAVLVMRLGSAASAAESAKPAGNSAPDVLVLVLGIMGSHDHVSFNYSSKMPTEQVQADLTKVASETRWPIAAVKIATASVGTPGAQPTTQLVFRVPGAADRAAGTLPLSPFVNALKRYKAIEIDYVLPPGFVFKGRKDYEDRYVKVVMRQEENSYNYRVQVKDSSFDTIRIPLKPDEPKKEVPRASMPMGARLMLIVGLAVVGAAGAYLATAYYTNRRRAG